MKLPFTITCSFFLFPFNSSRSLPPSFFPFLFRFPFPSLSVSMFPFPFPFSFSLSPSLSQLRPCLPCPVGPCLNFPSPVLSLPRFPVILPPSIPPFIFPFLFPCSLSLSLSVSLFISLPRFPVLFSLPLFPSLPRSFFSRFPYPFISFSRVPFRLSLPFSLPLYPFPVPFHFLFLLVRVTLAIIYTFKHEYYIFFGGSDVKRRNVILSISMRVATRTAATGSGLQAQKAL